MRKLALLLAFLFCPICAVVAAQVGSPDAKPPVDEKPSLDQLMVILRESPNTNEANFGLYVMPPNALAAGGSGKLPVDLAWYRVIGDLHARLVFDRADRYDWLRASDLQALHLTPETAMGIAVKNIERVYGAPSVQQQAEDLWQVSGSSPDYNSSYFLDAAFWKQQLAKYPDGVVACLPTRSTLLFVAAADSASVHALQKAVGSWYANAGPERLSSALFLFKADHWSVFQAPQSLPAAAGTAAPASK